MPAPRIKGAEDGAAVFSLRPADPFFCREPILIQHGDFALAAA